MHRWMEEANVAPLTTNAAGKRPRYSGDVFAPSRRRRAAHCRWHFRSRSIWPKLALLLLALPSVDCQSAPVAVDVDYRDLHGVVGGTDLSMFRKIGSGECRAPASRPVRGRSKRDLSHLWCRLLCIDDCLGYTYAPCERVCILHGDPTRLQNTSDADGWSTVNGGGKIISCSGRCGSSCYQRMAPCEAGEVVSNTFVTKTGPMSFGGIEVATCPLPSVGTLKIRCGIYGPYVEAGRCRSPCAAGQVVNGNFDVFYPEFLHGTRISASCPSGATGSIELSCSDGKATWEEGRCGYDCVLGSIVVGDAVIVYPQMNHTSELNLTCPNTTSGNVTIQCFDSVVRATRGFCNLNCDAGDLQLRVGNTLGEISFGEFNHSDENVTDCEPAENFTGQLTIQCWRGKVSIIGGHCDRHCLPSTIGPGVKAVPYPRFDNGTEMKLQCLPGFIGELELRCADGNATLLSGECMMHCLPGAITTNSINLPHDAFNHTTWVNLSCPWPSHYGYAIASCWDGAVTYKGVCGLNCQAGSYYSHGAWAKWDFIQNGVIANVTCPSPWVGSVYIQCYDSDIRYRGGWCGRQCPAGTVNKNGAVAYYPVLNHTESMEFGCQSLFATGLSFSGKVAVECYDGAARNIGFCEADCPNGKMTRDGSQVFYPKMIHGGQITGICSPGTPTLPLYGVVEVKCDSGYAKWQSGTCGPPCVAGEFAGPQTRDDPVVYPTISHLGSKWIICPPHLSGYIELFCQSGVVSVIGNGTCGDRCSPQELPVYGATFTSPQMEHRGKLDWPCDPPFNGVVKISCDFGILTANSECQAQCLPGNVTLNYGAVIDYPKMMSGDLFSTRCPRGFVDVPVVIKCVNGKGVVHEGGCYKNCRADWFYDPLFEKEQSWAIQHYEILHDSTTVRDCPQYYDGLITLSCWNGNVTKKAGICTKNCRPGRVVIRPGVVARNREMLSGYLATQIPCPPSFDGTMRLLCTEGVVTLGEGGCNQTCSPGIVRTAPYGELGDAQVAEIACPDTGTIKIRCNDGMISVLGGECFVGCKAGSVVDRNGTRIEHNYIKHGQTFAGACSGLASGTVNLLCNNTVVVEDPLPGERCLRSCQPQAVKTPDGSTIFPPSTAHGNQATVRCPNGRLGLVTITCFDTEFTVIDGVCGDLNCAQSSVYSNGAELAHYEINNGWKAGPTQCPNPYEGTATFWCRNGTTNVDEVTQMLPVSPQDYAAIAAGNESSEDARFVLCGCCNPLGKPPDPDAIKGRDTGIYIWAAALGGGLSILMAAFAGWYVLKNKKLSDMVPQEKAKIADPRPEEEKQYAAILDQFRLNLKDKPGFQQRVIENSFPIMALPVAERPKAIENIMQDPNEAKNLFSRNSLAYHNAIANALSPSPKQSPKTGEKKRSRARIAQEPVYPAIADRQNEILALPQPAQPGYAWADPGFSPGSSRQEMLASSGDLRFSADPPQLEDNQAAPPDIPERVPSSPPRK